MKVRNSLLAGLAVAATIACSNENDEVVDNSQVQGTENALIRLGIFYPAVTRATGDTEDGLTTEQLFKTAKVIVNGDIHTYAYDDFTPSIDPNEKDLYLKDGIPVPEGTANVYVILNLGGEPTVLYANITASTSYSTPLDGFIDYVAKDDEFLISNAGGLATTTNVEKGREATIRVNVERAAARLMEQSKGDALTSITPGTYNGGKLNITLKNYSFVNLQKDTYILANATPVASSLFQAYDPTNAIWGYKTKEIVSNIQEETPTATENITCCLENKDADNNTCVVYEAVAAWDNETEPATFYVTSENVAYQDFATLHEKFGNMLDAGNLTADSKTADSRAVGVPIKMYEGGKCYCEADIYTDTTANKTTVRDNVYKLNVSSITKLGDPTPTPAPDAINLMLEVKVLPRTTNLVDIILRFASHNNKTGWEGITPLST